jgi:hypothetical protein
VTQPSAPGPIVLGRIDESFHQVAAAVVEEVLLRLGHHRRRERDGRRRQPRRPRPAGRGPAVDGPQSRNRTKLAGLRGREVFRSLEAQIEAGGASLRDVVKLTTYLTDIRYREELNAIREEFFGPKLPAHTQVAIAALGRPEWLIEVEAIAAL